jgi:prophage antirepressor-like protein
LDDDEKGVHKVDTPGGTQEMTVVSESGLYSTVMASRKPEVVFCKVVEIGNPTMAAGRLDDEEKSTLSSIEGAKINGLAKSAANRLKPCEKMTLSQAEGHSGKRLRLALKQAKRISSAWRMELPAAETLTST